MNETINCIMTRSSVRSFSDKKISREDLETIANAAIHAPSARNTQMWKFIVLQDKKLIKKLAAAVAAQIGRGDDYNFYAPDAVIIATSGNDYKFNREDCSCALENIFLSAHALGIGSVWINQLTGVCCEPSVRCVLDELKVPSDYNVYGMAALGYMQGDKKTVEKKTDVIEYIL